MNLTPAQMVVLKADIAADGTLNGQPLTMDGAIAVTAAYNAVSSPDYWVWLTNIHVNTITRESSPDATVWSWPAFIARSVGEQYGWTAMFNGTYTCNPALVNVRQGFADIFSGGTGVAQRAHLLGICRRKASRVEKLFAVLSAAPPTTSGNLGSVTSVATMMFEGPVTPTDVYYTRLT